MKKQILLGGLIALSALGYSQATWNVSGNDITNPNTGNVGIGTSPSQKLHINGNFQCDNGTLMWGLNHMRTEVRNDANLLGNAGAKSGCFETSAPVNYPAGASGWWHLLDVRHSNPGNNYAMQIAGDFDDQDMYFRKTSNSATTSWSKIVANNGGRVGINLVVSATPSGYLHVKNAVNNNDVPTLLIENTSQGIYQDIKAQLNKVMKAENKGFVIENTMSAPGEVFKVYGEGRTLIGSSANTEVPTSMLQIKSPIERETFRLYKTGNTTNYLSLWQGVGGAAIDPIGTGKLHIGYDPAVDVLIGGNNNGSNNYSKLGIGTAAPNAFLHISTPNVTWHGFLLEQNSTAATVAQETRVKNDASAGLIIANTVSTYKEVFKVLGNGRTIIGSKTSVAHPTASLTVGGKIVCQDLYVTAITDWPDYVFADNYKLPSLSEVKSYYSLNKHLPGVPTAKEIEEKGISVSETSTIQMQKIEELTIYMVQLKEEIDQLKKENKVLKSKLEK
jgi:hypothetical protein